MQLGFETLSAESQQDLSPCQNATLGPGVAKAGDGDPTARCVTHPASLNLGSPTGTRTQASAHGINRRHQDPHTFCYHTPNSQPQRDPDLFSAWFFSPTEPGNPDFQSKARVSRAPRLLGALCQDGASVRSNSPLPCKCWQWVCSRATAPCHPGSYL